ncbi:MAG: tRNA pseudouridine(38-40) synthase TruA [Ruminococcaceae bacterium]|nr:tRNA pseudouridine(38-40) synthase TruA [Oscillospiraceae bacterium]
MRYLLTISYLGTAYHGWQVQPNGVTVQEKVQDALEKIYKFRPNVTGCSRTDAGVHALEFCCHFDAEYIIREDKIVSALNSYLPDDISANECKIVDSNFHARYSAKGKNYIYKIYNSTTPNPFVFNRSWHVSRRLDVDKMNCFLSSLVGTHDFVAFSSSGRTVEDTVRTITECKAEKKGDFIEISVTADGFLYNMVRIIVGTAVNVSDNKISEDSALDIIRSKDRNMAGITAPPYGLFLNKVIY